MKTLFKILAGVVLSLVTLALAAIVALVLLINPNDYKPQLEQLAAAQNVQLNIAGDLGWSFYPHIGIHAGQFSIKPPMKTVTKPFQFDSLTVSVKLLPLLHRQIIANNIAIRGKEIALQDATIKNLLIESRGLNLDQQAFPLSFSMNVSTTEPQRDVHFSANTQISVDREIKHLALKALTMQLDDTTFSGDIQATLGSNPFLKVNLAGTALDMDHYFPATPEKSSSKKKDSDDSSDNRSRSKGSDEFIPASSIQALPGNYHFSFQELTLHHLHGTHVSIDLTISPTGILTIKQLNTDAYGGKFAMHGTIDAQPARPDVALKVTLRNLELEPAIQDYFQIGKTFATGDFGFDASVTTKGLTWDQLMQAMDGEFSFASKAMTLNKVDLTSSLDASLLQLLQVKLPKLMSDENQTVLSNMIGKGVIRNGVMNNTYLTAESPCTQFNGAGSYNLSNADVIYHMGITFPSSDTNKICADINKKLKDIAWPVACKGSLDDGAAKICGADMEGMQKMVAQSAKKEAGKKLEKKLDQKLQKKFGNDTDAIKDKLKGLL